MRYAREIVPQREHLWVIVVPGDQRNGYPLDAAYVVHGTLGTLDFDVENDGLCRLAAHGVYWRHLTNFTKGRPRPLTASASALARESAGDDG